ncbi:MAG TPA: hydrogenase maturation protease [Bryobacteraceae bacterium]|nr:hydrogenase maturation protease [Bryobacteraceae bacterium]
MLVIGCGNGDRGDDAAGILVARRLRAQGIEAREQSGEALALMESWRDAPGEQEVILVDAVVTGAPPGTVTVWDARTAPVIGDFFRCSTHAFGVAEAIELARILDLLPPNLLIYGIEAGSFDIGSEPSPEVLAAVEQVTDRIGSEIGVAPGRN